VNEDKVMNCRNIHCEIGWKYFNE